MNLIAAVDRAMGIGRDGKLLYHIPEDMKLFQARTMGKVVVMGRGTLISLPGSAPLAGRTNLILSHGRKTAAEGARVCGSLDELWEALRPFPTEDVFVIGGESVFQALEPFCERAYLTFVEAEKEADRHFFPINGCPHWSLTTRSEPHAFQGIEFSFAEYVNSAVQVP